jgi:hypothetical protein
MTVKQHLESARNTAVTWAAHIPALESFLLSTRPDFYLNYTCVSLSDLLCRFAWNEAPGGFDLWERIFAEQHEKDNRDWWAYRLERIF